MTRTGVVTLTLLAIMFIAALVTGSPALFCTSTSRDKALMYTARAQLKGVGQKLDAYRQQFGQFPESLETLDTADTSLSWALRPQLDPWGRPLIYLRSRDGSRFSLHSLGSDRVPGGNGSAMDIIVQSPASDVQEARR